MPPGTGGFPYNDRDANASSKRITITPPAPDSSGETAAPTKPPTWRPPTTRMTSTAHRAPPRPLRSPTPDAGAPEPDGRQDQSGHRCQPASGKWGCVGGDYAICVVRVRVTAAQACRTPDRIRTDVRHGGSGVRRAGRRRRCARADRGAGAGDRRAARGGPPTGWRTPSWPRRCWACAVSRPGWRRWWPSTPRRSRPVRGMRRMGRGRRRIGSRSTPACPGARWPPRSVTPAGCAVHAPDPGGVPGRGPVRRPRAGPLPAWRGTPGPGGTSPTAKPTWSPRGAGCGSTTGNGCARTGGDAADPDGPNSATAATLTCAGSASVSASTGSGMPTVTSPRWPPRR